MADLATIEAKYLALSHRLDEATLRIWAAVEARSLGRGGVSMVAKAIGMSRTTIYAGLSELKSPPLPSTRDKGGTRPRVRAVGGGRKRLADKDASLVSALDALVEPTTRGDPMSPLRWTSKSTYRLSEELKHQGHDVSQRTVCDLLGQMGFSLQPTRKTREGGDHEDRDAQFAHIAKTVADYQATGDPVISVDTRKKELIGDFKNAGSDYQPVSAPEQVTPYDFIDPQLGTAAPHGPYDLTTNTGWVNVGIDDDTAEFAVESIRRCWREMGKALYQGARHLLITADCGPSNGSRVQLWHRELQKLADEFQLSIEVSHFPPGTSKWNKIEHRMFCHITADSRGQPLTSREAVVNLIGSTTTNQELRIKATLDENTHPARIEVSDEELATVAIEHNDFHGEWNYRLRPRNQHAQI